MSLQTVATGSTCPSQRSPRPSDPNTATVRAAIYSRVSSDPTGEGLGVERQEADCRQLAELRGWSVAEVFEDNDLSAYEMKVRPAISS